MALWWLDGGRLSSEPVQVSEPQAKIIVIGANVVGLMIALELLHRGHMVQIIDGDFSGPVRTHTGECAPLGGPPELQSFMEYSVKCWAEAGARYTTAGQAFETGMVPRGVLDIITSTSQQAAYAAEAAADGGQLLTTSTHFSQIVGYAGTALGERVLGVKWAATAPVISTHTVLENLRRAVTQRGAVVWGNDKVDALVVENGKVTGVRTHLGEVAEGGQVVLATTAALPVVQPHLARQVPLRPARGHMLTLDVPEEIGYPLFVYRTPRGVITLKRTREGPVVCAYDGLADPAQATQHNTHSDGLVNALIRLVPTLLPVLAKSSCTGVTTAIHAVAPDYLPVLGPVEGLEGLVLALGWGARGYACAAGAARLVGQHYAAENPVWQAFAPSRFSAGRTYSVKPSWLTWSQADEDVLAPHVRLVGADVQRASDTADMQMEGGDVRRPSDTADIQMLGGSAQRLNDGAAIHEVGKTVQRSDGAAINEVGKTVQRANTGGEIREVGKTVTRAGAGAEIREQGKTVTRGSDTATIQQTGKTVTKAGAGGVQVPTPVATPAIKSRVQMGKVS